MLKVITPDHAWQIGPGRGCSWPDGLPLPGHRSMAQVLAAEQRAALERGVLAFGPVKRDEPTNDVTTLKTKGEVDSADWP